jgi:hypothetical protein
LTLSGKNLFAAESGSGSEMTPPMKLIVAYSPAFLWILATALVAVHAVYRFSQPWHPVRRATTTWGRYWLGATVYALGMLGLYFLIATVLGTKVLAEMGDGKSPDWLRHIPPQVAIALFITVFLSEFPFLRDAADFGRDTLHRIARIPFEADRWKTSIEKAAFKGVDPTNTSVVFQRSKSLFEAIDKLRTTPNMSRFLDAHEEEYLNLGRSLESAKNAADWQCPSCGGGSAVPPCQSSQIRILNDFKSELCEFISYSLLYSSRNRAQMQRHLKNFGLDLPSVRDRWLNRLVLVFLQLTLIMFIALVCLPELIPGLRANEPVHDPSEKYWALHLIMIVLALSCSVALGCAPRSFLKRKWLPTNGVWSEDDRPWPWYLVSGFAAAIVTASLSCTFHGLVQKFQGEAFAFNAAWVSNTLCQRWGWCVLTFCIAGMTAYIYDDPPEYRSVPSHMTLCAALVFAAMVVTVLCLIESHYPRLNIKETVLLLSIAPVIGLVIGFWIPRRGSGSALPSVSLPPTPPQSNRACALQRGTQQGT